MRQTFIKNGNVRNYEVRNNRVIGAFVGAGLIKIFNPTLEAFYADGWEDYTPPTPPTPEPPTQEEQYKARVIELIREQYTIEDEISLLRQRTTKALQFATYFDFCEDCKKQAYREVYGTTPPLNL